MRLVILSDLHITEFGLPIWDTDTKAHFDIAIGIIKQIPSLDAIIVSGDVADKGSQWAYNYVRNSFDSLGILTLFVPGNHDNTRIFKDIMNSKWCYTYKSIELPNWKFISLSSVMPDQNNSDSNMSRGYLSDEEISMLKKELNTENHICIILHHPPIEQEGWLNRKLLENRSQFNNIIRNHDNVKLVIYGHTHYHSIQKIEGITYICSPAVGFAFNKDLPKFQIDKDAEALLLIEINDLDINCTPIRLNG